MDISNNHSATQDVAHLVSEIGSEAKVDDTEDLSHLLKDLRHSLQSGENQDSSLKPETVQRDLLESRFRAFALDPNAAKSQNEAVDAADDKEGDSSSDEEEEEDADEALQRILDELAADEIDGPGEAEESTKTEAPPPKADTTNERLVDSGAEASKSFSDLLNLPSIPTSAPTNPDDIQDRLAALQLPSAPTSDPVAKKTFTFKPEEPKLEDLEDEISDWCCICSDDAAWKCLGCDGDPYCDSCWREAHLGRDADEEERRHRCVSFVKGRDKKRAERSGA